MLKDVGWGNKQLTRQHQRYSMLLQLRLSLCSAAHSRCGRRIWLSRSQGRALGTMGFHWGCASQISCNSKLVPTTRKWCPTRCSWRMAAPSSCWVLTQGSGIGNARSVWARRCGTTCRNAAGAVLSCSCTRQLPHRHFFKCTGLLNQGGGIATLKRKTGACSA